MDEMEKDIRPEDMNKNEPIDVEFTQQSEETNIHEEKSFTAQKKSSPVHGKGRLIGKYALICILACASGFAGGLLADRVTSHETADVEIDESNSNFSEFEQKPDFSEHSDFGQIPDQGNETDSAVQSGAAIGIYGEDTEEGVLISGFPQGSNAEDAGLETGDIIAAIDGTEYETVTEISAYIATKTAGEKVDITVLRDGEKKTYSVTLTEKSVNSQSGSRNMTPGRNDMQNSDNSDFPQSSGDSDTIQS